MQLKTCKEEIVNESIKGKRSKGKTKKLTPLKFHKNCVRLCRYIFIPQNCHSISSNFSNKLHSAILLKLKRLNESCKLKFFCLYLHSIFAIFSFTLLLYSQSEKVSLATLDWYRTTVTRPRNESKKTKPTKMNIHITTEYYHWYVLCERRNESAEWKGKYMDDIVFVSNLII